MLFFKFQQNRTINAEFDFGREKGVEARGPPFENFVSIIIGKHTKMLCFKFQQNHTVDEEFDFFEKGEWGGMDLRGVRGPYS